MPEIQSKVILFRLIPFDIEPDPARNHFTGLKNDIEGNPKYAVLKQFLPYMSVFKHAASSEYFIGYLNVGRQNARRLAIDKTVLSLYFRHCSMLEFSEVAAEGLL